MPPSAPLLAVTLFDYGVGNIHSIRKALTLVGAKVTVVRNPRVLLRATAIVLPGVGAFGAAMSALCPDARFRRALQERLTSAWAPPTLGVCVGYQVLCRSSEESAGPGVGVFPTPVRKLHHPILPHMGWAPVESRRGQGIGALRAAHPALRQVPFPPYLYFAHSFGPVPQRHTIAVTTHGKPFSAIGARGPVLGVQFHPEKSGVVGLAMLAGWVRHAAPVVAQLQEADR